VVIRGSRRVNSEMQRFVSPQPSNRDAHVRLLPPRAESLAELSEKYHGSRILVPCLRGPYFGVPFYAARHARVTCLKPAVLVIVRLARRELAWINVTAHATAEWIAQQIVVNRFADVSQLFWVCGRDRAKGGRSFVGTCAMYENECRARQTQRGAKLILCDPASLDRTLAARPA
jgi:hypothetical protein